MFPFDTFTDTDSNCCEITSLYKWKPKEINIFVNNTIYLRTKGIPWYPPERN